MIRQMLAAPSKSRRSLLSRPWLSAVVCVCIALGSATPAFAADDDEVIPDARLTGYDNPVAVGGGVALSYALVAFLGVISVGLTFKNARRTHLD